MQSTYFEILGYSLSNSDSSINSWLPQLLPLVPLVYSFTLMWWIPEGDKYVPGMVIISLLVFCFYSRRYLELKLDGVRKKFLVSVWLLTLYQISVYFIKGDSWTELRALLTMAVYLSFLSFLKIRIFWLKLLLIISGSGLVVLTYGLYLAHGGRIGGFINPIPYATALAAVFSMIFLIAIHERCLWKKNALFLLSVAIFLAILMTQTRGIALPLVVFVPCVLVYWLIRERSFKFAISVLCIFFLLVMSGVYFISKGRIEATSNEVAAIEAGNQTGSIGLRLQMWGAAFDIWRQRPVFGWGQTHSEALRAMYRSGDVSKALMDFNPPHYHNQFIDMAVKKGALGLAIFVFMLYRAIAMVSASSSPALRWGGSLLIALYLAAGLTDVPYRHPGTVYIFFSLVMSIYLAAPKRQGIVR
ncbi:O-antigen ligase family protein [Marinobacter halodurans]|uniref:O-antigen ligase family protein n=1 Tax=Marinobacter halodurans TaxID=2528979 RepID=A0ABY1ZMN9_9GAMM|nr:O-antigen ligase family protein [Marinobacter halodurans]TBW55902.1 O-antigen ligase family protein [Marinobacter halodurans]